MRSAGARRKRRRHLDDRDRTAGASSTTPYADGFSHNAAQCPLEWTLQSSATAPTARHFVCTPHICSVHCVRRAAFVSLHGKSFPGAIRPAPDVSDQRSRRALEPNRPAGRPAHSPSSATRCDLRTLLAAAHAARDTHQSKLSSKSKSALDKTMSSSIDQFVSVTGLT